MDEIVQKDFINRRSSIKRYTNAIDRVVEDLITLESPSPKAVTREMTSTLKRIGTISENIKRNDLNPYAFQANHEYKMTKDKIKAYVDQKYNRIAIKDENRLTEILQNRPLTTFYKPSTKLLFDSVNQSQIYEIISVNKRKFGEFWNLTPKSNKKHFLELSPIEKRANQSKSPKRNHLSNLINKLLVKNLGIRSVEINEQSKERYKSTFYNTIKPSINKRRTFIGDPEEIIIRDEEDYLGPEYAEYISDVSNKLKIEKYIGRNSGKKRRLNYLNARLSKL